MATTKTLEMLKQRKHTLEGRHGVENDAIIKKLERKIRKEEK